MTKTQTVNIGPPPSINDYFPSMKASMDNLNSTCLQNAINKLFQQTSSHSGGGRKSLKKKSHKKKSLKKKSHKKKSLKKKSLKKKSLKKKFRKKKINIQKGGETVIIKPIHQSATTRRLKHIDCLIG